jgi:ribosome-associated heat shock protein Hsp15
MLAGLFCLRALVHWLNFGCDAPFNGITMLWRRKPQLILHLRMAEKEKLRVDKYLWSIRLFKTRSLASEACDKGRVKLNGVSVKASKPVNVGDTYEVKTEAKKWLIKVTALLHNRVQFAEAIKYYIDLTPEEEVDRVKLQAAAFHTGKRLSKIGRPTKKERRDLDDFTSPEAEGE